MGKYNGCSIITVDSSSLLTCSMRKAAEKSTENFLRLRRSFS